MTANFIEKHPAATLALTMGALGSIGACATEAGLDPVTTVFWRCLFATLFLGGWCLAKGYLRDPSITLSRLGIAVLGGVCIVLNWVAFFAGISLTSIATTTIVYHVQPFFVVLIGALFLGEPITRPQLGWMLAAFLGVTLASGLVASPQAISTNWIWGIVLTLISALLYAAATILAKRFGALRPEITAFSQTVAGVLLLAPFATLNQSIGLQSWGWLATIGLFHTGIAYVLMYATYPRLTTPVIGGLTFVYPLSAILIDWKIYHHPLTLTQGAGILLIALGTLGVKLGWGSSLGKLPSRLPPTLDEENA